MTQETKISGLITPQKQNYLGLPSSLTKWRKRSQKFARINLKVQNAFSACVGAANRAHETQRRIQRPRHQIHQTLELLPSYFLYHKSSRHLILVKAISVFTGFAVLHRS